MTYIVPRVLINQEFTQIPTFSTQPLSAFIFGPQYNLYRYSVAGEKTSTFVDDYISDANTAYGLPSQESGTKVDVDFVKVYFDQAIATYYPSSLGTTTGEITRVAVPNSSKYYPNRFKATNLVFATDDAVARSADFSDRDVKPGDYVTISSVTDDLTLTTKVKSLAATYSSPSYGTVTADVDNTATVAENIASPVKAVGGANITVITKVGSTYKGGYTESDTPIKTDTYSATVTTAGNLSAVRFTVHSAAGAFTDRTNVALTGTDYLILDNTSPNNVQLDFTSSTAFALGDKVTQVVTAPINAATKPTAGGTYKGSSDITYKLTVVRGGPFYTGTNAAVCARVAVSSSNIDGSTPQNVTSAVAINVGSYGATATFTNGNIQGGLLTGDTFYIPAIASAPEATNIIETYDSLPANFVSGGTTDYVIDKLALVQNLQVSQLIPGDSVDVNWSVDTANQTITINEGITTTDEGLEIGGSPIALPITSAKVYVEHRDLVATNAVSIGSVTTIDEIPAILGTIDPANPLAQGVSDAVENAAGQVVYFVGVPTNDLAGYNHALALATKRNTYYGFVPLTQDKTIQDAVVGHVNAMSTAESAKWRVAWLSVPLQPTGLIYDLTGGDPYQATITDDPLATGTQYTLVTVAGAQFVTDGVRATDKVLINFHTDPTGAVVHDEYVVSEVRTETTLVLVAGPSTAINSPIKVQIERVYTEEEQVQALATIGGSFKNRRVRAVFPDQVLNGTTEKAGYFVAAMCAGLRSGVVPHQGLTNSPVLGLTTIPAVDTFTPDQFNELAAAGIFIVTQDVLGSTPYVRHQLTTDPSSLNTSEDSITTNVDSISYALQKVLSPFIGIYNVNTDAIGLIRSAIVNELRFRQTGTFTARAGNQLTGFTIVSLVQSATFKDRVEATIQLNVPYPINFINITLVV